MMNRIRRSRELTKNQDKKYMRRWYNWLSCPSIDPWALPLVSNSSHFLTGWVSRLLGLMSWAFARVGVHRLSLRLPYLGVFPFTLHLPLDFIRVSSLRPTYLHPFGRPFTYSLFRRHSRLGTGSGTRCCGPRGGTWVRMEQKSWSKFLPWPRYNLGPWHLSAVNVTTTAQPLLLVASYDLQEDTAGQF